MLIRSASGLRGIAKDHFTPELIDKYISAFITTQNIKSCVIGRDGRPSGKQISQCVIAVSYTHLTLPTIAVV